MQRRLFSLEQANRLLPWLERTFERLSHAMSQLDVLRSRLSEIQLQLQRLNGTFDRYNEMNEMESQLNEMNAELDQIVQEITNEGILVRDVAKGLVDFPSLRDGRVIYLCWIAGEEEITHWHETSQGFAHRQPL